MIKLTIQYLESLYRITWPIGAKLWYSNSYPNGILVIYEYNGKVYCIDTESEWSPHEVTEDEASRLAMDFELAMIETGLKL